MNQSTKYFRFLLLLPFLLPVVLFAQKSFYVSTKGNDNSPGTIQKPFASAEAAKTAVRKYISSHPHDAVTIFFRQGTYSFKKTFRLDSLDRGHENAPIIYCAYPNEEVKFSGGISIPISKVTAITDKKILERVVPEAREKILRVDLKSLGILDYGIIRPKGFGRPYTPSAMELFCNEQPLKIARWPNDSMVAIGKVLDAGSIPRNGDYSHRGGKFTYNVDRPERWQNANDIWISGFFRYGYADDAVKIASLDTKNKTITTQQETLYGFEGGKNFQRWFAFNLLDEIDQPGEYYIDRENGVLYFYPPSDKLKSIELSVLETPLVVLKNTSNIIFRNIAFSNSRGIGIYIEGGKNNRIENCTIKNIGQVGVCIGRGIKPFDELWQQSGGEAASEVLGSLNEFVYNNTVFDREAGTNHVIIGCKIYNTGSGGVSLGGGNRLTLQSGNNQVVNCFIHDFNRINRSYKAGVNIDGVGNVVRNCEIYNCPGSAIYLHGNNHLIELNNIHDAARDGDDMGAIYYGRNPSEFGNKIRNNFFRHIGNEHGSIMAVYHDDGACGMEVVGNIFYKAGSRTVLIGGGNDNSYRNNIFIDCPLAFHIDARLTNWAKGFIASDGLFKTRLEAVNYKQPPYSTSYPQLVNYFEDSVGLPKRDVIDNNVFVNVKQIHNGKAEWVMIGNNFSTSADPGFIDASNMNFALKKNSIVFEKLPGFKAIPFEKIGVSRSKNEN